MTKEAIVIYMENRYRANYYGPWKWRVGSEIYMTHGYEEDIKHIIRNKWPGRNIITANYPFKNRIRRKP